MEALSENKGENIDESMIKCEYISKIIPTLRDAIKEIQLLANRFENNENLKRAAQQFNSLETVAPSDGENEKIAYVNEYRVCLISGLNNLADFLNGLENEIASLSEEQISIFAQITTSIINSQESIVSIAGY